MDGATRASKRRKLDTPAGDAPSPPPKPSTAPVRKSARAATRTKYKADGSPKEQAPPRRSAPKAAPKKTNGVTRQQKAANDADIWDDIEGALGEKPTEQAPVVAASARKRVTRKKAVVDTTNENTSTDELQKPPPSRRNGKKAAQEDKEDQDEPTEEAATPSRRASKRAAPPNTKRAAKKDGQPASLRKPRGSARAQRKLEFEDAMIVATPSARLKRAQKQRLEEDDTIPETDDEPVGNGAPATARATPRRRMVQVVDNGDDPGDEDDAMSVDGGSVVGSVLDPTEPSPFNKPASAQKETEPCPFNKPSSAQKEKPRVPLLSSSIEPGRELDLLKTIVLERISGRRPVPLVGLDNAYKTVHQLVENTVTAGEGNSLLVIGARGSGKTALVNKALSEISKDNSEDYHVVRLNGFIHTDDKIALREIWRQLGREMELEEENGGVGKSYADALTTLLALLSHPSEHTGEYTERVANAVVFIIDEFDLFAQHPRQTLLYCLFDIAQSRKAPIAVLGLTTNIDVVNYLEKRVKSRFSHRYVHVSLAKTFTAFQEICKANLLVQPEFLSVEERGVLESAPEKKTGKQAKNPASESALSQWNTDIRTLFASKSFLTTHLARLYYRSKSIPTTLTSFLLPTATHAASSALPTLTLSTPPDSKLALLPHLSTLALSLLIAACRLDIIHDSDSCNFHMAYDEYATLASKARIQSAAGGNSATGGVSKVWGKDVARREWEGLLGLRLVLPAAGAGGGGGGGGGSAALAGGFGMVRCDVSLEEVGAAIAGEKAVEKGLERWCRQL